MKKLILITTLGLCAVVSHAQTMQFLADSCFAQRNYSKAFEYYTQAVKLDTSNLKDFRNMGFCFMSFKGEAFNATEYFHKALAIQPNDPLSNYYMGVVFMNEAQRVQDPEVKGFLKTKSDGY